ncbi:MAG: ATP synthase F1 subunit gamma [Bacteroidales bacterium]|nr:ATP synthase F1 subunit gamma [Bacteroidales bacterium]
MASLKEIRTRIASVSSTRQITSAMKMVAAAKLKKAQDAIIQIRPYADKLHEILVNISDSIRSTEEENPYIQQREINKVLLVIVSSNRGLCGAFNQNIIKRAIQVATEDYAMQFENGNVDFYCIGKKAHDGLKSRKFKVIDYDYKVFDNLCFECVSPLADEIMFRFVEKKYDKIEIIYNQFKNPSVQILSNEQFLPITIDYEQMEKEGSSFHDFIFEPSKEYIVKEILPRSLKVEFYKTLIDSYASEFGARMTAMHQATDNADELIKELRLHYNKARQTAITKEITEIVGGAEALSK